MMKHLKMSIFLLLSVAIFTGCEKETDNLPANPEMNVHKNEFQSFKSIMDVKESGIDIENYINSLPKHENKTAKQSTSQRIEDTGLQFFSNPEEFPCSNLLTEDFEEANIGNGSVISFDSNLDENTSNNYFSTGDILSGVNFSTSTNSNSIGIALQGAGFSNNPSKSILANWFVEHFIINFTTNNVTSVSMKILSAFGEGNIMVEIFGNSGSLGATTVYGTNQGTYWGVKSAEPITKITLYSPSNQAEGIDDLSFGTCDSDGDGWADSVDAHLYSDLSEKINIGGCYPNVKNKMVKNGSTMMDQINDLTEQINSEYNGQNYKTLHSKFMTKLAQITYNWRTAKLITTTQRSQISSCAWGSNIPYFNNDN